MITEGGQAADCGLPLAVLNWFELPPLTHALHVNAADRPLDMFETPHGGSPSRGSREREGT